MIRTRTLLISFMLMFLISGASVYAIKNPFRDVIINEIDPELVDVLPGLEFCVQRVIESRWINDNVDFTAAAFYSNDLELTSISVLDSGTGVKHPNQKDNPGQFNGLRKDDWEDFKNNLPKDLKGKEKQAVSKQFKLKDPQTVEFCFKSPTLEEVKEGLKNDKGVIHYGVYGDDREDYEHSTYWNSGWKFKREINISNSHAQLLNNYTVQVYLNTSNFQYGNTNDTGKDIRFMNGAETIEIPYWIDYWNNTGESLVWVKVPTLQGNSNTTFYAYYGNLEVESDSNKTAAMWYANDFTVEPTFYISGSDCGAPFTDNPDDYRFNFQPVIEMDEMGFKANWDYVATYLNTGTFINGIFNVLFGDNITTQSVGYYESARTIDGMKNYGDFIATAAPTYTGHPEVNSPYDMEVSYYDNTTINWTMTNKTTGSIFISDSDSTIQRVQIGSFGDKLSGVRGYTTDCNTGPAVYGQSWGWNSTREALVSSSRYGYGAGSAYDVVVDNLTIRNFVWPEPSSLVGEEITSIYLNLDYPNGSVFDTNWTVLNCSVLNDTGLTLFVWHQGNGSVFYTDTQSGNIYNWNVTFMPDGSYDWNCKAENYNVYAESNYSFRIDTTAPDCTCNNQYLPDKQVSNFTYTDCGAFVDIVYVNLTNQYFLDNSSNWAILNFTESIGVYNATFFVNDTTGLSNVNYCDVTLDAPNYYYAINKTDANVNGFTLNLSNGTTSTENTSIGSELVLYNLQMPQGSVDHTVNRYGFIQYSESINVNESFIYQNTTFNLTKAGFEIEQVLDEISYTPITFNLSISNGTTVLTENNINNFSRDWDQGLPLGENVLITISSNGYEPINIYKDLTATTRPIETYYLLATSDGILVRIHVKDPNGANIIGAMVDVEKQINASWELVSEAVSDDSGTASFFLNPTTQYRITGTYGSVSESVTIIPVSNDYILTLGTAVNLLYTQAETPVNYDWQPSINALAATNATDSSINFTIYNFDADFTSWGLNLTYKGDTVFTSTQATVSGGTIAAVFNLTNVTDGSSLYAEGWYVRTGFDIARISKYYTVNAPIDPGSSSLYSIFTNFDNIGSGIGGYARVVIAFVISIVVAIAVFGMFGSGGGFAVLIVLGMFMLLGWFEPIDGFGALYLITASAYVAFLVVRRAY